ncbi:MAG: type I methionyl aminopeptidase [Nitrospiraceae bacterium]|nr:type I methionyl aminopeptidase [Nitrospiraceae bacterium]
MVILKSLQEIEKIQRAGRLVAEVLEAMRQAVRPGVSTAVLDEQAEKIIRASGAKPAFKGYRGYPRTLCTSINDQVIHGIPSKATILKEGDIVSIDVGTIVDGFYGDAAITVPVGPISTAAGRLIRVTEEALMRGIEAARPGNRLYDISAAVQEHVESHGYSVVREFVGHGIGRSLHEDPQVPNFGERGRGPRLQAGMVLAIEPMVNMGGSKTVVTDDQWTAVTADGSLSAHFEHTIAILDDGPRILTLRQ